MAEPRGSRLEFESTTEKVVLELVAGTSALEAAEALQVDIFQLLSRAS